MSTEAREQKNIARDTLYRLAKQNDGRLTPQMVVDVAKDETSPLHEYFEWDDSIAAHQYRLDQARTLIRSVKRDPERDVREYFEWDDSIAAHQYRLDQARTLIRLKESGDER